MNIAELRYVVAIAKYGSINTAAKELFAAQPNISKAVKNLEEEYKICIFERSSKGMVPTRAGQVFIERARKILDEIDKLHVDFMEEETGSKELRVSIPRASYASYAVVEYISKIKDAERIKIHVKECNSLEAINHILKHDYHLALIRYEMENEEAYRSLCRLKNLKYENIMDFHYFLLTSKEGPLASKKIDDFADLDGCIELLHGDIRLPNGDYVDLLKQPEHVNDRKRIHIYERGSQFDLLREVKESYMWVSPMPEEILKQYSLVQRECPCQKKKIRDVLVCPKDRIQRTEEKEFIEELKKEAKKVSGH